MRASILLAGMALVSAGCGGTAGDATTLPPTQPPGAASAETSVAASMGVEPTTSVVARPCPVTIPDGTFTPPDGYPQTPTIEGSLWHGSEALWTVLPLDPADYGQRKSVWWSVEFPGGDVEERPPVTVSWVRLDVPDATPHDHDDGTNAYTAADGWFMIAGIDPDEAGCWEVTATYKGATLSYVYERG